MNDSTIFALGFLGVLALFILTAFGAIAWLLWLEHKQATKGENHARD